MDDHFLELLKEIRYTARNKKLKDFSFNEISVNTGIPVEQLKTYVSSHEELVEKILEIERQKFEEIFQVHNFEGINAIDILLIVSKEVAKYYILMTPSITIQLKEKFPRIYQQHFEKRIEFIFNKIQINLSKGISQGMYREDLSTELLARLYISRLIDMHNPDLFPPEKFSFETLFATMFEDLVRSIAKPDGIAYFEKKIKSLKFEVDKADK
jgi:TetR/AcrR family transcriptional regulator, cholesterol catabolism regulator